MKSSKRQPAINNNTSTDNIPDNITTPLLETNNASNFISNNYLRKAFWISLIVILSIVIISGFNVGYHLDEMDMNSYGKANIAFYTSGGKDTSYLGSTIEGSEIDPLLRYYGSGFEYLAVGINKITGLDKSTHEFDVRHLLTQLLGMVALMFAGLTARKISGWTAALLTIWLMVLSPSFFGHIYFNTKDIPFCAGYITSIYLIIKLLEELPKPTWKTSAFLMLSLAMTMSIRIGGLLLIFYLSIFTLSQLLLNKNLLKSVVENIKGIAIKYTTIVLGSLTIVVISWPYVLTNPIHNMLYALSIAKHFPLKIPMTFEGIYTDSVNVPSYYLAKMLLITTPLLIFLLLILGIIAVLLQYKTNRKQNALLILFAAIFPVIYAIATHPALYSGWRHFLFIYPVLAIISAIGIVFMLDKLKKSSLKIAMLAFCFLMMLKPLIYTVKNHPYEYTYFNEIAGGFKDAFYNYENDYWTITLKNGIDWLVKNEHLEAKADTAYIASNTPLFTKYYIKKHYPTVKFNIVSSNLIGRNSQKWTYAIYNSIFIKPDYLENYFPPQPAIYTERIDDIPVTVVLKDTARLDFIAFKEIGLAHHKSADSLYKIHIQNTKDDNPAMYASISLAKSSIGEYDAAIAAAQKYFQYPVSKDFDYDAYYGMGVAYANKGDLDQAILCLRTANELLPDVHYADQLLQQILLDKQKMAPNKPQ